MATLIGLIADTHVPGAGADLPVSAYEAFGGCDQIFHCGDLHVLRVVDQLERVAPTIACRGNGDNPRTRSPGVLEDPRVRQQLVVEIEGLKIGVTHDLERTEYMDEPEVPDYVARCFGTPVDLAVCGHTHVPMVWGLPDGPAIVNPGSPTLPYGYRGILGTVGRLRVDGARFTVDIVDLATGAVQLHMAGPAALPCTRGPRPTGGY